MVIRGSCTNCVSRLLLKGRTLRLYKCTFFTTAHAGRVCVCVHASANCSVKRHDSAPRQSVKACALVLVCVCACAIMLLAQNGTTRHLSVHPSEKSPAVPSLQFLLLYTYGDIYICLYAYIGIRPLVTYGAESQGVIFSIRYRALLSSPPTNRPHVTRQHL